MKSYLSLIPIAAKVHSRQNWMTHLCIIFAVFLVTAVFSMAELGVRMEQERLLAKHGSFSLGDVLGSTMGQSLFAVALFFFILILIAGVLMISSSLGSNVAQRTSFFGMMRCLGMSKTQVKRFVRLEALSWCKIAIPIGVVCGVIITWVLCGALRFRVGQEFSQIPLFGISLIGIVCGIAMGIITVLIAASSPAKRAAAVSPIAAISGSDNDKKRAAQAVNLRFGKIETALGVHHAVSAKKNLILMTGSFALSIILFLSFLVLIDFVGYLMPQSAATADLSIASVDNVNRIDMAMVDKVRDMAGVVGVFGRRSSFAVPVAMDREGLPATADIISYDDFDLDALTQDGGLKRGSDISKVYGDSRYVLATGDPNSPWAIGDKVQIGHEELEIAGLLNHDPFSSDGLTKGKITLITASDTFVRLTGVRDYSLLMIQTTKDITDSEVAALRGLLGENLVLSDRRDQSTAGTYLAFVFCVYGFLAIISLVTVLNIVNSIAMSVSARQKQYGAMRAVGMEARQLTKMIAAEAFTYAAFGCLIGCSAGLLLNKLLFDRLITHYFSYALWQLPVVPLVVVLVFVCTAAAAAIYAPAKRLRSLPVNETMKAL